MKNLQTVELKEQAKINNKEKKSKINENLRKSGISIIPLSIMFEV